MGIRGLYTYIKKNLSNSDVIECVDLRDRTVFVDGDGFVQWIGNIAFANTPFAELPRVEHTLRSESFHLFTDHIIQLIDRNTVVFVFDVHHVHYELKREKKRKRKLQRAKGKRVVETYGHFYHEHPGKEYAELNYSTRDAFKRTDAISYLHKQIKQRLKRELDSLGVEIEDAHNGEADVLLARLHRQTENSSILGNDTDFVIHPGITEYYVLDDIFDCIRSTRWDVPKIVHALKCKWGIRSEAHWLLAIQCCGSDYVPEHTIRNIRTHLPPKPKHTSWIDHTMTHWEDIVRIVALGHAPRITDAANVYDPRGTPPRVAYVPTAYTSSTHSTRTATHSTQRHTPPPTAFRTRRNHPLASRRHAPPPPEYQ